MKMKSVFLILLIVLAAEGVSFAQATWKGLRFGMSEADVRKEYPASFEKKPIENGEFALLDRDQKLAGWQATAELYFDKSGKLEQIDLSTKHPPTDEPNTSSGAGSSLAVISVVTDKLVEKYGPSISQDGTCEVTATDFLTRKMFTCERLWKSEGETIQMYFTVKDELISSLALVYKPLANDI